MFIIHFKYCLSTLVLILLSLTAQAQVYKWTDDNGQTHYSQTPPKDYDIEQLEENIKAKAIRPTPTTEQILRQNASDRITQQHAIEQLIQQQKADEALRLQEQKAKQQAREKAALKAKNCEIAKNNLIQYQANPQGRKIDANGNVTRVPPEQYQLRTNQFRKDIQEFC